MKEGSGLPSSYAPSRYTYSRRGGSAQHTHTMKPNRFNSLFKFVRKILAMDFTKDEQRVKALGAEGKVSRYRLHKACALDTARSPGEAEAAALMAYDRGDPAALDELVKQGYVFGTLQEAARIWHEISLRDGELLGQRECVANSAATSEREGAVSNAAEEPFDGTDDGWMKIAPFGSYPGSRPGRPQHFTEVEANAMVGEFRSLRGRLGRMFRGAPVYIGHPDKDPAVYTDHRRLGKVIDLQARPDGLYGEVEWNALGLENKREGYWVFPSPRWDAPAGRSEFRPDRLISVGLTNMPRIAASEPVTNSQDFENENQTNTDIMDRKLLTEKLGLDVTATDEEILAKLTQVLSAAANIATQQTAVETAETSTAPFG